MNPADFVLEIAAEAHLSTFHPGAIRWDKASTPAERTFISRAVYGRAGMEDHAVAHVCKELAQLAEIEKHVASVMARILCEMQSVDGDLACGFELHHAISCFASEEINHANTFFRYIRELSSSDFRLGDNRIAERIALFEGPDSPWVKLAALCASAYVGESVITVFENRLKHLDPGRERFITRLLHLHGLDEARHVRIDHFVFENIVPNLTESERSRAREIALALEGLNTAMAMRFAEESTRWFGMDSFQENPSHRDQIRLTLGFREHVLGASPFRRVDQDTSEEIRDLLREFGHTESVHPLYQEVA